jgi:hypothetical protein
LGLESVTSSVGRMAGHLLFVKGHRGFKTLRVLSRLCQSKGVDQLHVHVDIFVLCFEVISVALLLPLRRCVDIGVWRTLCPLSNSGRYGSGLNDANGWLAMKVHWWHAIWLKQE